MEWQSMETAPKDGTEIIVFDGFGVSVAAFDAETTFEEFLTFCDDGEGEKEWLEYVRENPSLGWIGREAQSGDEIFFEPLCWMPMPTPPTVLPAGAGCPADQHGSAQS